MNLMTFGERYPFLKANLAFWERYIKARAEIFGSLSAIIKIPPGSDSVDLLDNEQGKPLLASLKLSIPEKDFLKMANAFSSIIGTEVCSVEMPDPVPVFEELAITADTKGFLLAEMHAVIASFVESQVASTEDAIHWMEPFCPICGAHAGLGMIAPSGKRNLVCSHCHSVWDFMRTGCGLCGHTDERGTVFLSTEELPDWTIENCDCCGHYLKIFDMRNKLPDIITYPLHSLTTWELDLAVRDKGYKPALFKVFERAGWIRLLSNN